ncbi:gas vesicle protein GvpN [Natrialba asiatica]|uniref:Gas vesicle protein GvpN n=1 Tax=Natrialba asiatica (strain ATCC 700177 / DSM 12278 / JCM 9576 / FERM P-10747 / NBRC 102637 / 172P1) TaxID=29540 RepID=M0AWP9_NATA1|nr:gas vesicle protein GvpN [Natrialba asiatica]ELZ02398.1 gas vesicle protein GvpN [Natrialba asiatica DSM 12278]
MAEDTSRKRKVRGRKIRGDREQKKRRRARKELARNASRNGNHDEAGTSATNASTGDEGGHLESPEAVAPEPFVETDAVESLRERITGWLAADQPVHLIGPTGCGKTALALSAAAARGRPVVHINGDEAVDTATLVGTYAGGERYEERDEFVSGVSKKTQIVRDRWVDNPLSAAVREGATLVYNEFSRSDPAAHNVLLSVFEEGVLERPGKRGRDRTIDVHPEFRAILTSNDAEYAGVHRQQDALLDRVVGVHVGHYDAETEREIVRTHVDVDVDVDTRDGDSDDGKSKRAAGNDERGALDPEAIGAVVETTRTLREELPFVVGTRAAITAAKGIAVFGSQAGAESAQQQTDGGQATLDDELLADVFTDVLGSKLAGTEIDDVQALRERITDTL